MLSLLSGGLDSATALAIALNDGHEVSHALTVHYGQKHSRELSAAAHVCSHYHLEQVVFDMGDWGRIIAPGSALLAHSEESLPLDREMSSMTARVPRSYVPGRNTILLALAQSFAEAHGLEGIVVGFNAVDFSGYPDCRPIFVTCWNGLASVATRRGYEEHKPIEVYAPIILDSKGSVVRKGLDLGVPYKLTWSCYSGRSNPCGRCDSCVIRYNAFRESGISDPAGPYEVVPSDRKNLGGSSAQ